MDLKTFLLARIAEDEEQAEACRAMGWIPAKKYGVTVTHPARVLAECAAKREIVEQHEFYANAAGQQVGIAFVGARAAQEGLSGALEALAAVYADHTDYQPEWAQEASQA